MNILLNNLLTLSADADGSHFIITNVTGLGAADIRTSSFLFSGRSGGMVTDQLYGFRTITITGKIGSNDSTAAQHRLDRTAMLEASPIGETIPVYITTFSGETYRIDCNVTDLKLEYNQRGLVSDYLLQLTAGDPYFYSTDGGDEQTAHLTRVTQGGYITPEDLPINWATGSAPTIVTNSGESIYLPRIEIHDQADHPVITNQTTGEQFTLNINMVTGDLVVIDMQKRTVTLNGSNIIGSRTSTSTWWGLQKGANSVMLNSLSGSDTVTADVYWRNGVKGI
jgi:hypothetical protein